ncbi:MAG: choice-of-anchor M domain-containing protein [Dermabacter sp.]|nr:choice-of-anchor M domain-containing protein [Dermabacter sp.]
MTTPFLPRTRPGTHSDTPPVAGRSGAVSRRHLVAALAAGAGTVTMGAVTMGGAAAASVPGASSPGVLGATTPTPTPGGESGGGAEDPSLVQKVEADEQIVRGEPAVLSAGHVDVGPRLIDGQWIVAARDDTQSPPTWRVPSDVVLHVTDAGQLPVPSDAAYRFIQADPDSLVFVVPQTEVAGVVWLGWNTQDPAIVQAAPDGVRFRFLRVSGPGHFSLFLQPGNFAPPQVLADGATLADAPAELFVETGTHTHANWVFTAPGVYLVEVEIAATGTDGTEYAARDTLRFAIGDATAPESALQETWPGDDAAAASPGSGAASDGGAAPSPVSPSPGTGGQASEADSSPLVPWLVAGGAAAVLGGGAGAYAVHQRRAKDAREAAAGHPESEGPSTDGPGADGPRA